jgi:hypothetical protein
MTDAESPEPVSTTSNLAVVAAGIIAALLAAYFHNRFWWAPDEGIYAHVAQQILSGVVLNGGVQDIHAGYVHFVHAGALALFGEDLVSLRYGLAVLTVLVALLAAWLLRPAGMAITLAGGIAAAAFFFLPFLNPSANWYALALTFVVVTALAKHQPNWLLVGFLVGLIFLTRQLSGVIVAMGVTSYAIILVGTGRQNVSVTSCLLARALLFIMALAICIYLYAKGSWWAAMLIGIWPVAYCLKVALRTAAPNQELVAVLWRLIGGAMIAALPLIAYHIANGTLSGWFDDVFITALKLGELDFVGQASYAAIAQLGLAGLLSGNTVRSLNGLYWLILLAAPLGLGIALLISRSRAAAGPLPVIALFFALVSVHYAIPIYLTFSSAITLTGILLLTGRTHPAIRGGVAATAAFLVVVCLVFQAGQPLSRSYRDIIYGQTQPLGSPGIDRASLRMEQDDADTYTRLVSLIHANSSPGDPVFAFPMNAELYFLADRRPAVRFAMSALGIADKEELSHVRATFEATPPVLVIHRPEDKYNTSLSDELLNGLLSDYSILDQFSGFNIYVRTTP